MPHTPLEHKEHTSDKNCECWLPIHGEHQIAFVCPQCGAAYTKYMLIWQHYMCFDCNQKYIRGVHYGK